jgi:hypothetical protein
MSNADADAVRSELARQAANARWRGQVISRAIATIASRRSELDTEQLEQLAAIADDTTPDGGGQDG